MSFLDSPDHCNHNGYLHVTSIFRTKKLADFTIKCGDKSWPVHSMLLYGRSKVLDSCFDNIFMESTDKIYVFKDIDAESVERMIDYCYTLDYTEPYLAPNENSIGNRPSTIKQELHSTDLLIKHHAKRAAEDDRTRAGLAHVSQANAAIAARFNSPPGFHQVEMSHGQEHLKHLKTLLYQPDVKQDALDQTARIFALAHMYEIPKLCQRASDKFRAILFDHVKEGEYPHALFQQLVALVYTDTSTTGLRGHVVDWALENLAALVKKASWAEFCAESPPFAADCLAAVGDMSKGSNVCPVCGASLRGDGRGGFRACVEPEYELASFEEHYAKERESGGRGTEGRGGGRLESDERLGHLMVRLPFLPFPRCLCQACAHDCDKRVVVGRSEWDGGWRGGSSNGRQSSGTRMGTPFGRPFFIAQSHEDVQSAIKMWHVMLGRPNSVRDTT